MSRAKSIYLNEFRLFGLTNLKLSCDASNADDVVVPADVGIIDEAAAEFSKFCIRRRRSAKLFSLLSFFWWWIVYRYIFYKFFL